MFSASGSLRAEDIAVVVAFVACGASLTDNLSVLQAVVFGGEGLPSVLDMVCDKWDNWLLSDCVLRDTLESNVERTANEWGLECIAEGKFLWKTQHQYGRGPATEHGLGDAIDICARNVVADVMGPVVEAVSSRVSFGGRDNALRVLAGCAASLTDGAVRVAKTVLVQRVFDCLAV